MLLFYFVQLELNLAAVIFFFLEAVTVTQLLQTLTRKRKRNPSPRVEGVKNDR